MMRWLYSPQMEKKTASINCLSITVVCLYFDRMEKKASHFPDQEIFRTKVKKLNIARSYAHIKEVVFLGYRGVISELELVMHFVKNATALEKIVIDPRMTWSTPYHNIWNNKSEIHIKHEMEARTCAEQQLVEKIPSRINLEIL